MDDLAIKYEDIDDIPGDILVTDEVVVPNLDDQEKAPEVTHEAQLVINEVISRISTDDYMGIPPPQLPNPDEAGTSVKRRVMKTFDERLEELKEYKSKFGHVIVSANDPKYQSLGKWCENMRTSYKRRQEGRSAKGCLKISDEQIRAVEELGFQFGAVSNRVTKSFEERLSELVEYKKIHGHVRVPVEYKQNPALGKWCTNMRQAFKRTKDGTPAYKVMRVTDERIQQLEELGFDFDGGTRGKPFQSASFDTRFEQLKEFRMKNGHIHVPQKYPADPSLGKWVNHIRTQYKLWMVDHSFKGTQLNEERVKMLENIGFEFNYRIGYRSFDERIEELKEFKMAFGHLNVPTKYSPNPGLGKFVNHMRTHYKIWEADKANYRGGRINDERFKILSDLGFQFHIHNRNDTSEV